MRESQRPIASHLSDFLDWLDIEKGLANRSQENYSRFLKKFIGWLINNKLKDLKPHELSPAHIWEYRVYLSRQSKKPLKRSTQNYYLIALRQLLEYFADRDIVSLPSGKIKLAQDKSDKKIHFLTLEQLKKLFSIPNINARNGLRNRTILEVLFSTGLRIAELVSLNRDQIRLPDSVNDFELGIVGKGKRNRTVYFSERAVYWLKKYLQIRDDKDNALFINYGGRKQAPRRLTDRSIERVIKKYALAAGLPANTTPHTLRHSFATDLLSQGVDLRLIQEFLGHRNISTTQIYAHVTNKQLKDIHRQFHSGKDLKD